MISTKTALVMAIAFLLILFGLYLFVVIREMRWKKQDAARARSEQLQQMMRLPIDSRGSELLDEARRTGRVVEWPTIPPYQAHVNPNKDRSLCGKARVKARKAANHAD